ncbi:LacI family DNA-binding transcriptional regulator [Salinicoccus luteus]|uniref:LacI family DNA-binding transcriptional regulator n=1 Tax=Salinicoccus luteus TaxID=367840 RepID=UPI0004E0F627|nr:LacI family DNA-binding transcriptional regulator [Salinicoccus luteus]
MKNVTINDVAHEANVSKSTVSHYLNGHFTKMGPDTRERIARAVRKLDYSPNHIAKSLKNKRTMTIGVIVANILHNFSTRVIRSIEDFAHGHGYHVIVCNTDNSSDKEADYIRMLMAKQVDGLVVIPTAKNEALFMELAEKGYPVVFVDRYIENVPIQSHMLDNRVSVMMAFDHLSERGHREIGFLTEPVEAIVARQERYDAYLELCGSYGIRPISIQVEKEGMVSSLDQSAAQGSLPESLIVANDLALFELLKMAKQRNILIPEELSIISIDDIEFADFFNPGITVIAQPAVEIGTAAVSALFEMMNGSKNASGIERFQPYLIERESVKQYEDQ